jgi:hypothetical protein
MNSFRGFIYSWYFIVPAGTLLGLFLRGFLLRLWIATRTERIARQTETTVTACPLCHEKPPKLLFVNRCSRCGCQYDQRGNVLDLAKTTAQLQELNRQRFAALEDEIHVRRGLAEWNEAERAHFAAEETKPNPDTDHCQPGSSKELKP